MPMEMHSQSGFSLVELAIVVLIIGLVLGGLTMPLAVQRDNARIREGRAQLHTIESAVQGFALSNGFLPCPATPSSSGLAAAIGGACSAQHGFVPATTLSIDGARNEDNLLLDSWGSPVRYSVTAADSNADGNWDFTAPGEMRIVTMTGLQPDLAICSTAAGSSATACADASVTLSDQAPLVIYSLGKDWSSFSSADQLENTGSSLGGGVSGINYPIAADGVFVSHSRSDKAGTEFDDLVVWMSSNTLYRRLVDVGRLP